MNFYTPICLLLKCDCRHPPNCYGWIPNLIWLKAIASLNVFSSHVAAKYRIYPYIYGNFASCVHIQKLRLHLTFPTNIDHSLHVCININKVKQ